MIDQQTMVLYIEHLHQHARHVNMRGAQHSGTSNTVSTDADHLDMSAAANCMA